MGDLQRGGIYGVCPRDGCNNGRRKSHFACSRCWYELPQEIRDAIWSAWRLYQADPNQLDALRASQQKAIDFWRYC